MTAQNKAASFSVYGTETFIKKNSFDADKGLAIIHV
jgi:hypothetical protein